MSQFQHPDRFQRRHIGPSESETREMLNALNVSSLDELIDQTVPASIRLSKPLNLPEPLSEFEYLQDLKQKALLNKVSRNYIGMGYYGTITPSVIARNLFQNPGWYTQYTPYQAEIAQGRLESLLNYQTMVCDLTGLPIANASLLDEGTAAAEAMHMFHAERNKRAAAGEEANIFFEKHPVIARHLQTLVDVGLGYVRLGQSAPTLSGGEAQRVKLSAELAKRSTGKTLYVLDEPTTGLHFDDVRRLLTVLHRLVDGGNSVLVIEHNLDVVYSSDWVVELGPEGGDGGGLITGTGTPEDIAKLKNSHTGRFLKPLIAAHGIKKKV